MRSHALAAAMLAAPDAEILRSCETCFHFKRDIAGPTYDTCRRFGYTCESIKRNGTNMCGPAFQAWEPNPELLPKLPMATRMKRWLLG